MYEVEIKFRLTNREAMEKKIQEKGGVFSYHKQDDHIFVREGITNFSIEPGENVLRIRIEENKKYLTLKQRANHLEYETEIIDEEMIKKILEAMHYHELVRINKSRKETKLEEYNITIDQIEKLGDFMEIEFLTSEEERIPTIKENILKFAYEFGLTKSDIETKKYDELMLEANTQE